MIATVTRIGLQTGKMIPNIVLEKEEPSIAAASSSSTGIPFTYPCTRNIDIGSANATYGNNSVNQWLDKFVFEKIM